MTVKINADTSDGLKFVSDTSGAIDFQSNGTTVASLDSSGNFSHNGIEVDMWRLNTAITTNSDPITTGLERVDNASFAKIGTGMSVSSGIWSFPRTGLYEVKCQVLMAPVNDSDNIVWQVYVTEDNGSNFDEVTRAVGSDPEVTIYTQNFFNVTDISTHKLKFRVNSINAGGQVSGSSDVNFTCMSFIRLGDSQ